MAVYLNASSHIFAKNCQKRPGCQLGQSVELPYFSAFDEPLLSFEHLYTLLEAQIEQCVLRAGWPLSDLANIPILLGSTAYVISACEHHYQEKGKLDLVPTLTTISQHLTKQLGSRVINFATSCTSSAQAMGYAAKMIEKGLYDRVLVVGFEMFNRLTFEHFQAMGLLAQDEHHNDIILGEGVGCIALSNVLSNCEIVGIASLTDNQSLTNNSIEALGALIHKILDNAQLSAEHIQAIKPHLVGGEFDGQEQDLLEKYFPHRPHFAIKKQLGHTLGASGALETAWLLKNVQQELICLNYFLGFGGSNIGWILKWKSSRNLNLQNS